MGGTAYIIIHGTSQDIMSLDENTVKLARFLKENGAVVYQIGGPGSVERVIKRIERLSKLREPELHSGGGILDYASGLISGTVFGTGMDEIVEEALDALNRLYHQGFQEIKVIGFSRGAVAAALTVEKYAKFWAEGVRCKSTNLSLGLLDPVPGPYFVQKKVTIPSYVKRAFVLVSRDEGRTGFDPLELSKVGGTELWVDIWRGVHGDIGGSTKSTLARLSLDKVVSVLDIPYIRLSPTERAEHIVSSIVDFDKIRNRGFQQMVTRRDFGWGIPTSIISDIEAPSAILLEDLASISPVAGLLTQHGEAGFDYILKNNTLAFDPFSKRLAQRMEYMVEQAERQRKQYLQYWQPRRSSVGRKGRIVHHSPTYQQISVDKVRNAVLRLLKSIPK